MSRSKRVCFLFLLLALGLVVFTFFGSEKRVLIIAPTPYEEHLAQQFPYTCYFYHLPNIFTSHQDLECIIDQICDVAQKHKVDGLLSCEDYAGAALVGICSQKLGLIGPSPLSVLTCQHKYYSRTRQKSCVPEATPKFSLGPQLPFPCFVKPIKSSFSRFAKKVHSPEEITSPDPYYFDFFDQLIAYATPFEKSDERMLREELLQGVQVTWEGYIYHGAVHTLGIVDSILHPATLSFQRFEYPSQLSQSVQKRMEAISKTCLTYIGLDNTLCNIEFMYDQEQDHIAIIEINPRMALQFADFYEKVDGTNSYEVALAIATGREPKIKKGEGKFSIAASFVLRSFEDRQVVQVPTAEEIAKVQSRYPEAIIIVDYKPGQKLSDYIQDGTSFRYGLIHLGGKDREDLFQRYEESKKALTFTFSSI